MLLMNAAPRPDFQSLHRAIDALWQAGKLMPGSLYRSPTFVALRQVCGARYNNAGLDQTLDFALSQALYNLGFRWTVDSPAERAVSADIAAKKLDGAFCQSRSRRIHLCPLDQADDLPHLRFSNNSIRKFTVADLDNLLDPLQVRRRFPEWRYVSRGLSQFSWLVVEEFVEHPTEAGARVLPSLFSFTGEDFGRIEPHRSLYPTAVEAALFSLLTAPWEDMTVHCDFEWRPFRIPWVYSSDDDLFARIPEVPSADSLTWEPDFHENENGETVEFERPLRLLLEDDAAEHMKYLNDDTWSNLALALGSPLFSGPVKHFLIRAFATDGIDEFLAHILVIEAALGLFTDQSRRPKLAGNPGATARVGARLKGLLQDPSAGQRYLKLFDERSRFLHGRAMDDITGQTRLDARRLARRCVCALIDTATSGAVYGSRDAFLDDLLRRNWSAT
jgi:hypothetical protein